MRGFVRQLIWLIRRNGFKMQVVDEGRSDVLIPEQSIPSWQYKGLESLESTSPAIKTTLFVRRWTNAPPDLKCANCGCNPEGEYYEEQ